MIERMAENDKIVSRYITDREFQGSAFPILAREIFEEIRGGARGTADSMQSPSAFDPSRVRP